MRLDALKRRAVFQALGDTDEAGDLEPLAEDYVNEGYERLCALVSGKSPERLVLDGDVPDLPEWMHPAIADFATWLMLRGGNPQRQARGLAFRAAFEETAARALREGGPGGKRTGFVGIYP